MLPESPSTLRCLWRALPLAATLILAVTGVSAQEKKAPVPPPSPVPLEAAKKVTSLGTYADSKGEKHNWEITSSHALIWDKAPYLPVGGTFSPRSLQSDAEAAWQEDVHALEALKAKGLADLLLWPEKPLPDVSPRAFQRLVDYLDANGFRYGIGFGAGMTAPLTGMVVRPAYYRYADDNSLTATWNVTDTAQALFLLVDISNENRIVRSSLFLPEEGVITAPIEAPPSAGRVVGLLYPRKQLPPAGKGILPDLWNGFDDYRDRLLAFLGQVKLGPGFRFFHDPLGKQIGLLGEADYLIPDSSTFRLEFEAFLLRHYPNLEELKRFWGLAEGDFRQHSDLARLIPLWANERGVPYFYDPVTRKFYRVVSGLASRWWQDFLQCRTESIQYYMNALANVLKRNVADVPVVYTWTHTHPMFWNPDKEGGFDGLSIVVRGRGASLLARTLGPAYSEAEQALRTVWCLATQVSGEGEASPPKAAAASPMLTSVKEAPALTVPYASRESLFGALDELWRAGWKGCFADGFQVGTGAAKQGVAEWLSAPEHLDWLHAYSVRIAGEGKTALGFAPPVLFFPQMSPGPAHVGVVPGTSNVLWLNSFASGEAVDWWPVYTGYTLRPGDPTGETTLVSLQGPRKTHLAVQNPKIVRAFTPEGEPVPVRILTKTMVEVMLDTRPTVFRAGGQKLVPQEAAEEVVLQLGAMVRKAMAAKLPAVDGDKASWQRALEAYKMKDFETAYTFARSALDLLTEQVAPYIWREGEAPNEGKQHTFNEIAAHVEASRGGYLRLSTPNPPPRIGYGARYVFDIPQDGRYNVWLAGTVPGPGTSPIRWRVNTEPEREPIGKTPQGPLYLNERFGWILLGTAELRKGPAQSLSIYVVDRAQNPAEYIFSIDAILLTTGSFVPNGPFKPSPVDPYTLRSYQKDKNAEKP